MPQTKAPRQREKQRGKNKIKQQNYDKMFEFHN